MGRGNWRRIARVLALCGATACGPSPKDDFNAWVLRALDPGPDQRTGADDAAPGPSGEAVSGPDGTDDAPVPSVDLTGSFLLVFTTELKVEPSRDVRLDLSQTGRIEDGDATLSGKAVAVESPDVTLGTVPAAPVGADGRFRLVIEGFVIPPGQEPLLPDGGIAEVTLDAAIVDADRFCGPLDFHLLSPADIHQAGAFGAYRTGAVEPGGPGCD